MSANRSLKCYIENEYCTGSQYSWLHTLLPVSQANTALPCSCLLALALLWQLTMIIYYWPPPAAQYSAKCNQHSSYSVTMQALSPSKVCLSAKNKKHTQNSRESMTACVIYAMQAIFAVFVSAKTLNSRLKFYHLGYNASTMFRQKCQLWLNFKPRTNASVKKKKNL